MDNPKKILPSYACKKQMNLVILTIKKMMTKYMLKDFWFKWKEKIILQQGTAVANKKEIILLQYCLWFSDFVIWGNIEF